jgi:hypothetical protein
MMDSYSFWFFPVPLDATMGKISAQAKAFNGLGRWCRWEMNLLFHKAFSIKQNDEWKFSI